MIPQNLIRTPKGRANIPLPFAIAGAVVAVLVLLFIAVAVSMGGAPDQVDVVVPLTLK
jgi:hypothetical protein